MNGWVLSSCLIPTIWEIYNDRNGENKKGKRKDLFIALALSGIICAVSWLVVDINPIRTAVMILGWRLLVFDYAIQYVLIKRGIIVGHWFTYTGKTAKWDRMVSKAHPALRIVVRVALFGGAGYMQSIF
jgi:hypothetical protein